MELQTSKQKLYYKEVIRLHQEKGYGNRRISHILPISRSTVTKWITIFASENKDRPIAMKKKKTISSPQTTSNDDIKALQAENQRLKSQLKHESLRADAYNEMINVAEGKFKIPIRKKAGVKQ